MSRAARIASRRWPWCKDSTHRPRLLAGLVAAATLALGAGPATIGTQPPATFTQPLDGTTVTFDMRLVKWTDPDGTARRLYVSTHEVSWDVFDVFVYQLDAPDEVAKADGITRPSKPYISMDRGFGHAGYPAISMTGKGAAACAAWLREKTGRPYRLPTEAEWLAIWDAGGLDATELPDAAWGRENSGGTTHPVAKRRADTSGLHDMAGNAAEWVRIAPDADEFVVLGGSYLDPLAELGPEHRQEPQPAWNASDPQFPKSVWWLADAGFVGFRLVCDVPADISITPDADPTEDPDA